MNDEKKYEKLIKDLKSLRQVKAPANFEADLRSRLGSALTRRINAEEHEPEEKSFWGKVFIPSRLIPSLGLSAAAVIIFLVVNINSEEMDNPFLIEPRLREDIIEVSDFESFKEKKDELKTEQPSTPEDKVNGESEKDEGQLKSVEEKDLSGGEQVSETESVVEPPSVITDDRFVESETSLPESTLAEVTGEVESTGTTDEMATGLAITKEELNFRQVQLTEKEQQEVNELKMKVQSLQNVKSDEHIKQK